MYVSDLLLQRAMSCRLVLGGRPKRRTTTAIIAASKMLTTSPKQKSASKLETSHISSQSSAAAAAAEAETIRNLRREVLGLTLTLDALKKNHTKEWVLLNSRLEVAREELDAVLEDQLLFRSISSSSDSDDQLASNNTREECEELLDKKMIPTPPLVSPDIVQQLDDKLSRVTKYSLEWFEIKKKIIAETNKCKLISNNASVNNPSKKKFVRAITTGSMIVCPRKHHERQEKRGKMMMTKLVSNLKNGGDYNTDEKNLRARDSLQKRGRTRGRDVRRRGRSRHRTGSKEERPKTILTKSRLKHIKEKSLSRREQ
jgi:hypothetical protein